jgi:DNA-binding CsgD family transcriptional regulator
MAVSYIYFAYKNYKIPCLKPLIFFIVFFDLKLLVSLIEKYYQVNLIGNSQTYALSLPFSLVGIHIVFFFCATTYALLFFIIRLDSVSIPPLYRVILAFIFFTTMFFYVGRLTLVVLKIPHDWYRNWNIHLVFIYIFYFLTFVFLIQFLILARKNLNQDQLKVRQSFGYFYTVIYIIFFLAFLFPVSLQILIILVSKVLFNIFPVFWIRNYLLKYSHLIPSEFSQTHMESMTKKYGISQREWDIIKLLLQGKSNREVAEQLCIAHHTVKNHVYRLYQKLGVHKRYQLVNFFSLHTNEKYR